MYAYINDTPSQHMASSLSLFVGTLANAYNNSNETSTNNPNVLQVGTPPILQQEPGEKLLKGCIMMQ
ncbi:hypothetical protein M23134_01275 [Microscilla marina ATCC 23134]|uniref:Uncharacterized protein n=2 Tax=Microscilla marina TaxID=1027 RepID=A2A0E4_MICM2|nr:hypothetical protein M23134_01275 [Microscilla marina ATCC 23134]